jgi:tetratricopeptide (TPR) repeat protein
MGAWDIDGDGHRDLVFLGINNGYDWMNSLAAIRVYPWIRRPDAGDAYTIFSPDHPAYRPVDAAEIFYSLLPRGRVPDDPNAARWDAKQRQLTVTLLNGRTIRLSPFGFFDSAPSQLPDREREALRRQAYHHDREARRLGAGQYWNEALMEARGAVGLAAQAGDPIAKEALQRDLMKLLIASGRSREGIATMDELVLHSENASEIFYEAALALHLAGRLDEAVTYYDAGIRHGSPEEGKSKHEFIQAEVFALVEQGKFDEALAAIRRFNERYTAGDEGWTAPYREFIRWRMGQIPNSFDVPPNATDLLRYWDLEFRSARGEDPKMLLKDVEGMLRENNRPRCSLLSLKAAILKRLGDDAGSRAAARDALAEFQEESARSLAARAAIEVLRQRLRLVSPRAPT